MATIRVELKLFLLSFAAVGCLETMMGMVANRLPLDAFFLIGSVRMIEIVTLGLIFYRRPGRLAAIGISPGSTGQGLAQGMIWSIGFGFVAMAGFLALILININPVSLIGIRLPSGYVNLTCFVLVGGLISPIAEEMFFRGVVFGFFRRWGFWPALFVSTAGFIIAHLGANHLPLTQAVGGILFAFAYEKTGSLLAPITIHVLGNLAIFAFSVM